MHGKIYFVQPTLQETEFLQTIGIEPGVVDLSFS
jgi:hypothetical protein